MGSISKEMTIINGKRFYIFTLPCSENEHIIQEMEDEVSYKEPSEKQYRFFRAKSWGRKVCRS
jgi:deoxycytidylate deaminase